MSIGEIVSLPSSSLPKFAETWPLESDEPKPNRDSSHKQCEALKGEK